AGNPGGTLTLIGRRRLPGGRHVDARPEHRPHADDRWSRGGRERRREPERRGDRDHGGEEFVGQRRASSDRSSDPAAVAPGFEPGRGLPPYTLSRRAPSSARASHREKSRGSQGEASYEPAE